jgi:hypothetical protein
MQMQQQQRSNNALLLVQFYPNQYKDKVYSRSNQYKIKCTLGTTLNSWFNTAYQGDNFR